MFIEIFIISFVVLFIIAMIARQIYIAGLDAGFENGLKSQEDRIKKLKMDSDFLEILETKGIRNYPEYEEAVRQFDRR